MQFLLRLFSYPYQMYSFFQRKVLFDIQDDDLVLDVGSGDKPFWRADVIADKDTVDDAQRASGSMLIDRNKLFIEADVENLPFKDKAFDFVFCAHLLEHVEHPDRAIKELTRVARRGYIEVPG
ncbi:class I SAM-dependent methyltransferase, partial [Candidatus Roizmanbacteria bacterium]|nr:class I SAM-dependent methyltransferase [Candidatus Roizmanbacteria bacterium]